MAATIPLLTPGSSPRTSLRNELRDGALRILDELARQMLDSADDTLFRISESASSDTERRNALDTMRVLRLGRDAFLKDYARHLGQEFSASHDGEAPAAAVSVDYDSLSLQQNEELEEKIALGNMATRVDGLFAAAIHAVERRLDAARALGLRLPPRLLGAQTVCTAFGKAVAGLQCSFEIKLVVCKLFERVLCRDYGRLLAFAAELLDRHGIEAPAAGLPAGARPASAIAAAAASTPWNPASRWQPGNGGWFDELLASPVLSTRMRIAFEALRAPLAQRAEQDPSLLADQGHPVRQRIAELIELANTVAADPAAASSFNIALENALGSASDAAQPALDRMVLRLREQLRDQRTRLLRQVRSEVMRELELRSFGRELTPETVQLLRAGIAPLLALHLLNGGRNGPAFKAADALCDRLLASLEFETPLRASDREARQILQAELRTALAGIGMAEARVGELLDGLVRAWAEAFPPLPAADEEPADAAPPTASATATTAADAVVTAAAPAPARPVPASAAATPPAEADDAQGTLLARVLLPEAWFRVYDPAQNQTRWLKLSSYYATEDQVTFSGFDESKRLSLRASRFVRDLLEGRSEAINPSAEARAALDVLRVAEPPAELASASR